jgi:uncharacterized protein YbcV (DUF1398 family)
MTTAIANLQAAQQRALTLRPAVGGFPVLAEVLRRAGVQHNEWTLPGATSRYETDLGCVVVQGVPLVTGAVDVAPFDRESLVAAIRADQAGNSTFPEFMEQIWSAGVVRYAVDFAARTCIYYGHDDTSYVEEYANIELADATNLHV